MVIHVTAEQEFRVGHAAVIVGRAPSGNFVAVFEDDGTTGYFYAVDVTVNGSAIQDALHVYNAACFENRDVPSVATIGWSSDSVKAILLINQYPHAVFDFEAKRGYCRTGLPPPLRTSAWGAHGHEHEWQDAQSLFV